MKTSKIVKCTYTSNWLSPSGTKIYYHELVFENGDSGSCGRMQQSPDDIKEGATIEYEINDRKIKFIRNMDSGFKSKGLKKAGKHPHEFLGYAYSYAKDLVVAGKTTPKDMENLKFMAEEIYTHIINLLHQEE